MNYNFNLDEWLPRFPLKALKSDAPICHPSSTSSSSEYYKASMSITSPYDICNNEQLRREIKDQIDWGPAAPVDIFIMADGEPENRWVTKNGGLPYRPANLAWPTDDNDKPLQFIAQFDFTDSLDITGPLPGDVLLFFGQGFDDEFPCHFEWQPLGLHNLVDAGSIPYQKAFDPSYGHIFRTTNFPSARHISDGEPVCRGKELSYWDYLFMYRGTSIGPGPIGQLYSGPDDNLSGRLLCTLSGVYPNGENPYSLLNIPEPLPPITTVELFKAQYRHLFIGDLGACYISIDDAGKLYADFSPSG